MGTETPGQLSASSWSSWEKQMWGGHAYARGLPRNLVSWLISTKGFRRTAEEVQELPKAETNNNNNNDNDNNNNS